MLHHRRPWLTGAVTALTLLLLSGCGGTAQPAPTAPAPAGGGATAPGPHPACIVKQAPAADLSGPTVSKLKARGKLNAGTKVDVLNFGFKDPATGKVDGYEIDILRQISCKIYGASDKWEATGVTAKTRLDLLNGDQIDFILATMTMTEERKKQVDFTDIYYTDAEGILVKKDSGIKSLKDMEGKAFGVQQGSTAATAIPKEADKAGVKATFNQYNTYAEALTALQSGRVQAMTTDVSILTSYQKQAPETVLLADRFSPQPYAIATKKGNDDLAKLLSGVLQELNTSGQLTKWQDKWNILPKS